MADRNICLFSYPKMKGKINMKQKNSEQLCPKCQTGLNMFILDNRSPFCQYIIALGAGLAVWGVVNLLEGYGNDNPGANAHVR